MLFRSAHSQVTEVFTSFGERQRTGQAVAADAVEEARAYLASGVPVGPHLADQLLVPLALAGGGAFTTMAPTGHTRTNVAVIERFLPVRFDLSERGHKTWQVSVRSA